MARPNRAVLADAGVTVVLGVAFVASTAGATGARRLDGLGWALVAMGAASGVWDVDLLEIGSVAIMFVSGWVLGVVLAARRGYTRALQAQTAALEAARQELARRAVLEERTRIARDRHDILAHAMSVITVQAGAGAHLLERDPSRPRGRWL